MPDQSHDVFLCHSSHDRAVAEQVVAHLESRQFRCWIAPRDIVHGTKWDAAIMDGIERCRVMALILSAHAMDSEYVLNEVGLATELKMPILPLRIAPVKPAGALKFHLARIQWIDALTPPLQPHIEALALRVGAALPPPPPVTPTSRRVYVSYAWREDSSRVVDGLCTALAADGWEVVRDREAMRPGDRISAFMNQIARADRIVVVLSEKYLRSPYCMRELYGIYQRSVGDGAEFLERVKPLTLEDARFGTWRERKDIAEYWRQEYEEMSQHVKSLGALDLELFNATKAWHNAVGDILAHVNDVLQPRGFAAIVENDYAGLRQMLGGSKAVAPGTVKVNPKDGLPYVWIPPGKFLMGCSPGDEEAYSNEKPAREETISKGFWIGQTPVTQAAYERVMGKNPSHFKGPKRPVEQVTWHEAVAFANKVGMGLPTEVEWEYAARAGNPNARYGPLDDIAWYRDNAGQETHDVAQKQPNAWGLYDTLGNVWEWTSSVYDSEQYRVVRGGSWGSNRRGARVADRDRSEPTYRYYSIGFRLAGDIP